LVNFFPFQEKIIDNVHYRKFSRFTNNDEMVWHRDKEDRYVKVLNDNDWEFQFDNELPFPLKEGSIYFIPKMKYHRVIKGKTDLELGIKKIVDN